MSDTVLVSLTLAGAAVFFGLLIAFLTTNSRRHKSPCPECKTDNKVAKSWFADKDQTKILGEVDIAYGYVSGIASIGLGLGIALWMIQMIVMFFDGEVTGVIWFLALLFFGIYSIYFGIGRLSRTARSKGKTLSCSYKCVKCGKEWAEEDIIAG